MDWPNRFPYLVPVWQSFANKNLSRCSLRIVDPNYEIDFGGIGTFNGIWFRHQRRIPFRIARPPLPFHMSRDRSRSKFAAQNCLAYDDARKILITAKDNQIHGYNLSMLDMTVENPSQVIHEFSPGFVSPVNPFSFGIVKRWQHDICAENILDIRFYRDDTGDDLQVMTHSRIHLGIFRYVPEPEESQSHLSSIVNIDWKNQDAVSNKLLDVWDRNNEFPEEFLTTFIDDKNLYCLNLERNLLTVEGTIMDDITKPMNRFITVEYFKNLNPFLYVFGTHRNILLGDMRVPMAGSTKASLMTLANAEQLEFFKSFEMFHSILLNPYECHQFITASDFNITFFDLRYPNKNLFQCKHMMTGNLVNKLVASSFRPPNQPEGTENLLLLASNNSKTALLSFNCKLAVQPSMLHVPFYLASPLEINNYIPFETNPKNIFPRGMQILSDLCPGPKNFFSTAFLLNNGDIFMQDFRPEDEEKKSDYKTLDEFKYENDIGNQILLNQEFDPVVKEYMRSIYMYGQMAKSIQPFKLIKEKGMVDCRQCGYMLNIFFGEPCDNPNYHELPCSRNVAAYCTCLKNPDPEENLLCNTDADFDENVLFTRDSQVMEDGKLKLIDNDPIDFEMIRANWRQCISDPSQGIRQYCQPLTQKMFDLWCQDDDGSSNDVKSELTGTTVDNTE